MQTWMRTVVGIRFLVFSLVAAINARGESSFYTLRPPDSHAVTVAAPSGGDDTELLQEAIDKVRDTTGQGIVFLGPGRYRITNTIYIWASIRVIGYGATRPVIVLPANTPGFSDAASEKIMIFFAGGAGRRRNGGPTPGRIVDANPGTFYSALANVDLEIQDGNAGAVGVRAHYAQHCFMAHMDFRLGPAIAGIHEAGNVVEDLHFYGGRHAIWTGKPSPSWQFTVVDCTFEGQREAAILERDAGLTLVRPHFLHVPTAVSLETNAIDELWVKDARLEEISGPAFEFGVEKNARNEINIEGVTCRDVPVFAWLRDSGTRFRAPGHNYLVKTFSHGLHYSDTEAEPRFTNIFDAVATQTIAPAASDLAPLPPREMWVNVRDFGAKGDGTSDDTEAFKKAIAAKRAIYLPMGFYVVRDTLMLRPDTVLIGLHPGATQIILPDNTPGFDGTNGAKALIESPKGGSNILFGIGLYTSGNNPRAVAALWKAGTHSMLNDVRFLGGHGTPKPDGTRENPYNSDHSADPDPNRHWDSQYPSLWVTDGGGGTFFDIWTPSTFAHAGMKISDTETEGRVYQISSEHHVKHEIQIHHAANWRIYALQTEEERGESGHALPLEIEWSHDITIANFHSYRVISSFQPFPYAAKVEHSQNIHFRNFHSYSNSKVSFDAGIFDQGLDFEIRQHEFAWLDMGNIEHRTLNAERLRNAALADGARVEKLAGGFFNISGGAADADNFYFVDAHSNRVYRWSISSRHLSTVSNAATLSPVNLMMDKAGNVMIVSYIHDDVVYAVDAKGSISTLKPGPVTARPDATFYLPVSDWNLNQESLSRPAAHFISPDGKCALPVGQDFLDGTESWGIKSSPPIRSFGLAKAAVGQTFYETDESANMTWAADVQPDGGLKHFRLFANRGGEGVVSDSAGNVYVAAGQIYVYDHDGKWIGTIDVPERPVQMAFGGPDGKTMFIAARSSLYAVRLRFAGGAVTKTVKK